MKILRIAHITATFPPHWTGAGLVCYYNARELARRGHEVHVYTAAASGSPAEETLDGYQVHRLRPLFQVGNAPLLPGLLALQGFDLLHLHYPFISGAEFVGLVAKVRRMPYVLTYHNDLIGDGARRWLFAVYSRLTAPWVFAGARALLPVSRDHAEHSRLAPLFCGHPEVIEIPNGVDITVFAPNEAAAGAKQALGLPANTKVVLFVGALDRAHHYRRLDVLLEAFARADVPQSVLIVVGDGELLDHYRQQAADLGVIGKTLFLGACSQQDLPIYYQAADFTVLPSSIQESFGLVVIESMACGTPVVTSDLPGVRSVVDHGIDGLLVPPGDAAALADAIHSMLALPDAERRAMGAAGRRKAEQRYTWKRTGDQLEALYQQIVDQKRA